jgi:ABC-type polysaccharide/polyol phosphate export permease
MIPLLLQFYIFTLGVTLLVSALTVLFQDLKNIMVFAFQIIFYMSPSLYAPEHVPEKFRSLFMLNPFSIVFTSWRDVLMFDRSPDLVHFGLLCVLSLALLIGGFVVFVKLEKVFPKLL